jgi:DNA repair protein RadA/Sms
LLAGAAPGSPEIEDHGFAFGEVGLAGEVRPAPRGQERLKEAAKLGFSVAVVPKANAPKKAIEGLTIHAVERVEEAMEVVRSLA